MEHQPLVKSVATSSPWIFILNPLFCDRLLFSTFLPIFGPIHQSGSQQKRDYVPQLGITEFTEGLFRKYRKEKCSMKVIAAKYCGCLETAVTSTEGPSQPLGNLILLRPFAFVQVGLPGHRATNGLSLLEFHVTLLPSPFWCHCISPEHSFSIFPPLLILCFYSDICLFIHLNFYNGIYFIFSLALPV